MLRKILEALLVLIGVTNRFYWVSVPVDGAVGGSIYAANDAVGRVFAIPVPVQGILETAKLIDPSNVTLAITAHLFTRNFTGAADNAAFTISADDALKWITSISFDSPIVNIGSAKVSEKSGATYYRAPEGFLWCQCSTTGTPTITAGLPPILQLGIRAGAENYHA